MRIHSTRKRILVTGGAGFLGSHHRFGWSRPAVSHLRERLLAKRILDWTPRVALDDGLTRAIACFRDSSGGAP